MYRGSRILRLGDIFVARHFSSLFSPLSKQETCTVKHVARPPAGACRGNVQPPAGRACTDARRDKVRPQARRACTAARRGNVQPPAGRAHTAARRTAGGRDKVRPILISCEHSLLAGEAWFETKVCIRRENSCTQSMVRDQSMHSEREFMHAGHASCLHSCARSAGVGWGWEGG